MDQKSNVTKSEKSGSRKAQIVEAIIDLRSRLCLMKQAAMTALEREEERYQFAVAAEETLFKATDNLAELMEAVDGLVDPPHEMGTDAVAH